MVKKIVELAKQYVEEFVTEENYEGKYIKVLKDRENCPELENLIYELHEGSLPSDLVYQIIFESLELISECENDSELEELEPIDEIYTNNLLNWFKEFYDEVNTYQEEFGYQELPIMDIISAANFYHRYGILKQVIERLKELVLEEDDS